MLEFWRRMVENLLPEAVERWAKRTLPWLFWSATTVLGYLFTATQPLYGVVVLGLPLVVIGWTKQRGLANVPLVVLICAGAVSLPIAFFLGMYEATEEVPHGLAVVGGLAFLLWITTYPMMLTRLNDRYRGVDLVTDRKPAPDLEADLRVMMIKTWLAAIIMFAVGDQFAAVICLLALKVRRPWTARAAGLVCLVTPFLSLGAGGITVDVDLVTVVAVVFAVKPWLEAAKHPLWDSRMPLYLRRELAAHHDGDQVQTTESMIDPVTPAGLTMIADRIAMPAAPVDVPWEFSAATVLGPHLPAPLRRRPQVLDRLGAVQLTRNAITIDGSRIPWSAVTALRCQPAHAVLGGVARDALVSQVVRLLTPLGRRLARKLMTELANKIADIIVAVIGRGQRNQQRLGGSSMVPYEIVYRSRFGRYKMVRPGPVSLAVLALPEVAASVFATAELHNVPITMPATK
jgi:hypothetical protein